VGSGGWEGNRRHRRGAPKTSRSRTWDRGFRLPNPPQPMHFRARTLHKTPFRRSWTVVVIGRPLDSRVVRVPREHSLRQSSGPGPPFLQDLVPGGSRPCPPRLRLPVSPRGGMEASPFPAVCGRLLRGSVPGWAKPSLPNSRQRGPGSRCGIVSVRNNPGPRPPLRDLGGAARCRALARS